MTKTLLAPLFAVVALVCAAAASANDGAIRISQVIPYESAAVGTDVVREECPWNRELSEKIVKGAKGRVESTDADLATLAGTTLHVVINTAHAAGGGSVSGPKWARITGELKEDDRLIGNFTFKRITMRPFTFRACTTLSRISDALAQDVVNWLKNPGIDPNVGKPQLDDVATE